MNSSDCTISRLLQFAALKPVAFPTAILLKMGMFISSRQPTIVKTATTVLPARFVSIWPKGEWSASELWSFRSR